MRRLLLTVVSVVVVLLALTAPALAADINVPGDYATIQAAIDAAVSGDRVLVAAGIYSEHITLKSGVVVRGAGAATTTIDGGGAGNVVYAGPGVDVSTRLTGFSITHGDYGVYCNGASPVVVNNIIFMNLHDGIFNDNGSSPLIRNNIIFTNGADGIQNKDGSSPTITGNQIETSGDDGIDNDEECSPTITNNTIRWIADDGISTVQSSPLISGNTIEDCGGDGIENGNGCLAEIDGNAINNCGDNGIHNDSSNVTITNNTIGFCDGHGIDNKESSPLISNNSIVACEQNGIRNHEYSHPTITGNTIVNCGHASGADGIHNEMWSSPSIVGNRIYTSGGDGIATDAGCAPLIDGNLIVGNTFAVSNDGAGCAAVITNNIIVTTISGGISISGDAVPVITNNTLVAANVAIRHIGNLAVAVTNNIIVASAVGIQGANCASDYNNVWGNTTNYSGTVAGPNDISVDPRFVGGGDYHLRVTSPCIDMGSNTAPSLPDRDYDRGTRVVDGNDDGTATADMGADEVGDEWGGFLAPLRVSDSKIFVPGDRISVRFRLDPPVEDVEAVLTVTDATGAVVFTGAFAYSDPGDYYYCVLRTAGWWGMYTLTATVDGVEHSVVLQIGVLTTPPPQPIHPRR